MFSEKNGITIKKDSLTLITFLSKEQTSSIGVTRKRGFSGVYHFHGKASLSFTASSFHDILMCLDEIKEEGTEIATSGNVKIYASQDSPGIQRYLHEESDMLHFTQDEYGDFVSATWELYNMEEVKSDLEKEYIEDHGAL